MKKFTLFLLLGLLAVSSSAAAVVSVRYYNRDSQKYAFPARCSGSSYTLAIQASSTATATIQGASPCTVSSAGAPVVLKGGENIEIKDGKIILK